MQNNQQQGGGAKPQGTLAAVHIRDLGLLTGTPVSRRWRVRNWWQHKRRGALVPITAYIGRLGGSLTGTSELRIRHISKAGLVTDYGLVSRRVVTTAGMNWLVSSFNNTVEPETMKYHGVGTGTTAEASADTALVTESTTALNPDNTRATGSTTTGGSSNIYRTVGTVTFDASAAITEHGIFNQAATGGGTLLDRSVFSAINVASGDSIQFTYDLTFAAGG